MSCPSEPYTSIYCPYKTGELLNLTLDETATTCEFEITRVFSPFSISVVVTARPVSPPVDLKLPPLVVLKILDPRHVPNDAKGLAPERSKSGWSEQFSKFFLGRLSAFRAEKWINHWEIAETEQQPFCAEPDADEPEPYRNGEEEEFALEMDHIQGIHETYETEVAAYRALQSLQGTDIPKLYGTAKYAPDCGTNDPILATVPCLILEYIDGNPLHDFFIPGISESSTVRDAETNAFLPIELSAEVADRASIAMIEVVRRFRDLGVVHDDEAPRNIILRTNDRTRPVFIDFGMAQTEIWTRESVLEMRRILWDNLRWHIPSPCAANFTPNRYGSQLINYLVPKEDSRIRDACYEEIPANEREQVPAGADPKWEPARWKLKTGIRLSDEDNDWMPKRWQLRRMIASGIMDSFTGFDMLQQFDADDSSSDSGSGE